MADTAIMSGRLHSYSVDFHEVFGTGGLRIPIWFLPFHTIRALHLPQKEISSSYKTITHRIHNHHPIQ
jgi:hypothetical protein